jgi:hypothetical protein
VRSQHALCPKFWRSHYACLKPPLRVLAPKTLLASYFMKYFRAQRRCGAEKRHAAFVICPNHLRTKPKTFAN